MAELNGFINNKNCCNPFSIPKLNSTRYPIYVLIQNMMTAIKKKPISLLEKQLLAFFKKVIHDFTSINLVVIYLPTDTIFKPNKKNQN